MFFSTDIIIIIIAVVDIVCFCVYVSPVPQWRCVAVALGVVGFILSSLSLLFEGAVGILR